MNPGASCGGIGGHLPGFHTVVGVIPGHAIVGALKSCALIEIQNGKDHCRKRGQSQHDRPEANSQRLFHNLAGPHRPRVKESWSNLPSTVW